MEKYTGVRPESEAKNTPNPEYSHTETHGSQPVKYFHTWRNEWENEVPPVFRPDEEPNRTKIRALDRLIQSALWLGAIWFIIYLCT